MNGCQRCKKLQAQLQAARAKRDWERAKSISLEMSDHVQISHPELWAKGRESHAPAFGRK